MGRRRTRRSKKQLGGATNPSANDWGLHLHADIQHDFGDIGATNFYNLNEAGAKAAAEYVGDLDERRVMLYLFNKEEDVNRKLFMGTYPPVEPDENILEFSIPERTAQTDKTVFTPIVDISSFGIVYDAGTFITTQLGARNVISFGNILDPASTTKDEDSKPIFANKPDGKFQFPLSEFGFDPAKVGTICIKGVTPQTANVGINLDGVNYDGISLNTVEAICDANTPKNIRDVAIDRCGIFTSLTKAAAARITAQEKERTGVAITNAERAAIEHETWFKIGKTLGDTLLVASTMRDIGGNPNPFLAGPWVDWNDPTKAIPEPHPTKFMFKTGDTLNHARAVLKNVPSILERPATKKYVKRYEFVPAEMSQVNYSKGKYETLKENLISSIQTGYSGLINELRSIDTVEKLLTNVDFEADDKKRSAGLLSSMRPALEEIANDMGRLSAHLSAQLQARLELTSGNYKTALEFARNVTPSASVFTKDYRTKTTTVKSSIHVTVPDKFADISVPGLVIPYYNILTRARYGSQTPLGGEYSAFKIKLGKVLEAGAGAGAGAGQEGGAGEEDSMIVSPWEHPNASGKLVGQDDIPIVIPDQAAFAEAFGTTKETTQFPTIMEFQEYLGEIPVLSMIYGLKQHYHDVTQEPLIEDTIVLERILGELERLELLGVHTIPAVIPKNNYAILQFNLFVNEIYKELAGSDPDEITRLEKIRQALEYVEISPLGRENDGAAAAAAAAAASTKAVVGERTSPPESPKAVVGEGTSPPESPERKQKEARVLSPEAEQFIEVHDEVIKAIQQKIEPLVRSEAMTAAAGGSNAYTIMKNDIDRIDQTVSEETKKEVVRVLFGEIQRKVGLITPADSSGDEAASAARGSVVNTEARDPSSQAPSEQGSGVPSRATSLPPTPLNKRGRGVGGLRRTYRKQRNVASRTSRASKHSRLRKRTGTRRSDRV